MNTNNDYSWLDECGWSDLREYLIKSYKEAEALREINRRQFQKIGELDKLIRGMKPFILECKDLMVKDALISFLEDCEF